MFSQNVIELEGKEGKYYVEKVTMMTKYQKRDTLLDKLTYSQFVKRYTSTKSVPVKYSEQKGFEDDYEEELQQIDIDNENFIFSDSFPVVREKNRELPKHIPINNETEWMQLRKPLILRIHKHKKSENPHE